MKDKGREVDHDELTNERDDTLAVMTMTNG